MDDVKNACPLSGLPVGAFMGEAAGQSQPTGAVKLRNGAMGLFAGLELP
jgi:hypothetical protein